MRNRAPNLILAFFFSGGNANAFLTQIYVPTETYPCRMRCSVGAIGSKCKASIAWTRVHTIVITARALKLRWIEAQSEMHRRLIWRHVDAQGELDPHRTVAIDHGFKNHGTPRGRFRSVRSPSDRRCKRSTWRRLKR